MEIIIAVIALGVLGVLFGVGLAVASKKLAVQVDPRLDKLLGLLPGANCGACGAPGCFGLAEAVLSGKQSVDACRVAEDKAKEQIAKLLGQKLDQAVKKVAVLHCSGGVKVADRFLYTGIKDCISANLVLGGQKACVFGCLGYGSCVKVCPFGALAMSENGLPVVDYNKCRACNKCVITCPKKLFTLVPVTHSVHVSCSSHDLGKNTRAVCSVGCIACGRCEKACPFSAIAVTDNLAMIDYHKCTSCGKCVEVCPMKTIHKK